MKKYRIAYVGVFDLKNYGDHLYPLIFQNEMKKRNLDFELVLFSNYHCYQDFGDYEVYSLDEIEKINSDKRFDCVIIGGGEIIHPYLFKHTMIINNETKEIDYNMLNIWMSPILFCNKNNIPCILNGVGVPFSFDHDDILAELFESVSYISVRNITSKENILSSGMNNNMDLIPDLAFLVGDLYSEDELDECRNKLNIDKPYFVFQTGKGLPEDSISELKSIFEKIQESGMEIVFLPLAYTNQDDIFLNELARKLNVSIKTFPKTLCVKEIVAVLSGSKGYLGLSLHGTITSASYGITPIMYDYYNQVKNIDLFNYMNLEDNRVTDYKDLNKVLLLNENKTLNLQKIENLKKDVSLYYDKLLSVIENKHIDLKENKYKDITEKYLNTLFTHKNIENKLQQDYYALKSQALSKDYEYNCAIAELDSVKKTLQEQSKTLFMREDELKHVKKMLEERDEKINDCKVNIQNCEETIYQLKMINGDLKEQNNNLSTQNYNLSNHNNALSEQMHYLKEERDALEAFRVEVINSKMFKLFHMFDKKA